MKQIVTILTLIVFTVATSHAQSPTYRYISKPKEVAYIQGWTRIDSAAIFPNDTIKVQTWERNLPHLSTKNGVFYRWDIINKRYVLLAGSGGGTTDSSTFVTRYFGATNYYPLVGNPSGFLTSVSHNHTVYDANGVGQFNFGVNDGIRFQGTGSIAVSFDPNTHTVTFNGTSGTGADGNYYVTTATYNNDLLSLNESSVSNPVTVSIPLSTKENAITAPSLQHMYWNGYKRYGTLNADSVSETAARLFETPAERTKLNGLSGTNSGDETQNSILLKLGYASASTTGAITQTDWLNFNGKAPLTSPQFAGIPTVPTPTAGNNSTQVANTSFVQGVLATKLDKTDSTIANRVTNLQGIVATTNNTVAGHTTSINANTGSIGVLPNLNTAAKGDLVSAVNEINARSTKSSVISMVGYQATALSVTGGSGGSSSTPTGGAKYYVDSTNTGTGAGTLANPWKTIAQVESNMGNFHAGDSIMFRTGTHYMDATNQFIISCSGNSTYPVVFCSYKGADNSTVPPYFQCAAVPNTTVIDNRHVVDVSGSYVTLDGLDMICLAQNATDHTIDAIVGYGVWSTGNYNTFRNLHISRVGDGININTGVHDNLIEYCLIENGRMIVDTWSPNYDDYGANGVVIEGPNNIVRYSTLQDLYATTFDFSAAANPSTSTVRNGYDGGAYELYGPNLDNNQFYGNTVLRCRGFLESGSSSTSGGITVAGGSAHAANLQIYYNKFSNIGTMGSFHGTYHDPVISNCHIYNNVFVEDAGVPYNFYTNASQYLALIDSGAFQPSTNVILFKNNITYMNTGQKFTTSGSLASFKTGQFVHTNNIIKWGTGPLNFTLDASDYSTTAAMLLFTDTTSRDPSLWNYTPAAGSMSIDYGTNVGLTTDFAGNGIVGNPDAGILDKTFTTISTSSATDVLIDGTDFLWNSSYAAPGQSVYLEIVGSGTSGVTTVATLYTKSGTAVSGSATVTNTASTIGRSAGVLLTDGETYQVRWKATGTGTGYIKAVRLIIK